MSDESTPYDQINELLMRIQTAINNFDKSPGTAEQLRADALEIRKEKPGEGELALALVALLEKDLELIHKHFKAALKIDPENEVMISNYGGALIRFGQYENAIQLLKQSYTLRDSTQVGTMYGFVLSLSGKISEAKKIQEELEEKYGTPPFESPLVEYNQALQILEEYKIDENDLIRMQQIVANQLNGLDIVSDGSVLSASEGGITYQYFFDFDDEKIEELEEGLEKRLKEAGFSEEALEWLSISYLQNPRRHQEDVEEHMKEFF